MDIAILARTCDGGMKPTSRKKCADGSRRHSSINVLACHMRVEFDSTEGSIPAHLLMTVAFGPGDR